MADPRPVAAFFGDDVECVTSHACGDNMKLAVSSVRQFRERAPIEQPVFSYEDLNAECYNWCQIRVNMPNSTTVESNVDLLLSPTPQGQCLVRSGRKKYCLDRYPNLKAIVQFGKPLSICRLCDRKH